MTDLEKLEGILSDLDTAIKERSDEETLDLEQIANDLEGIIRGLKSTINTVLEELNR